MYLPHLHTPPPYIRWPLCSLTGGCLIGMWLLADRGVSPASLARASCASQNTTVNISMATGSCALDLHDRIGIFAGITASAVVLSFVRIFLVFCILINGGRVLHNKMFSSIMRVPVRFFDTNPSGKKTTPTLPHPQLYVTH